MRSPFLHVRAAGGCEHPPGNPEALRPVGLSAHEGRTSTDQPGRQLGNGGSSVLGPHESTITCSEEEFGIHQRRQQPVAVRSFESPQPLRLRRRQPQPGHFQVLALNSPKHVVKRLPRSTHCIPLTSHLQVTHCGVATDVPHTTWLGGMHTPSIKSPTLRDLRKGGNLILTSGRRGGSASCSGPDDAM